MYAFAEEYLRTAIHGPELSNQLYTPSYLSLQWTLGYYGMIPEKVVVFTGVTSRSTQCFQNTFGTFDYRHVKPSAFFGYRRVTVNGKGILLAEPEKALLDLWHLERGEWSEDRMAEMRFQQFDMVNDAKLLQYAERFGSPRISAAVQVWMEVAKRETEGTVQL
jgi:predicted transcriptional regulator of viral defense system